jgi:hypothetical protein
MDENNDAKTLPFQIESDDVQGRRNRRRSNYFGGLRQDIDHKTK